MSGLNSKIPLVGSNSSQGAIQKKKKSKTHNLRNRSNANNVYGNNNSFAPSAPTMEHESHASENTDIPSDVTDLGNGLYEWNGMELTQEELDFVREHRLPQDVSKEAADCKNSASSSKPSKKFASQKPVDNFRKSRQIKFRSNPITPVEKVSLCRRCKVNMNYRTEGYFDKNYT